MPTPNPPVWDPTAEMSGWERFLAGSGKAFHDLYRGTKQALNIGDQPALQREIDEAKRLDQPLMNTGLGSFGHTVGNVAALAPAAFIPGVNRLAGLAAFGAASGAIQPTASDESAFAQTVGGVIPGGEYVVNRLMGQPSPQALAEALRQGTAQRLAAEQAALRQRFEQGTGRF